MAHADGIRANNAICGTTQEASQASPRQALACTVFFKRRREPPCRLICEDRHRDHVPGWSPTHTGHPTFHRSKPNWTSGGCWRPNVKLAHYEKGKPLAVDRKPLSGQEQRPGQSR
jgi:hypothetical protein